MADFIKIEGVDDTSDAGNVTDDKGTKYLDTLMGVEADAGNTDANAESGDAGKATQDGKQPEGTKPTGDSSAKDSGTQQKPDQAGKKDEKPAAGANNGDLTLADGSVVKGGAERRHYEKAKLAESQLSMRNNELKQANESRDSWKHKFETLNNTAQSLHGADPAYVSTGIKLVRDLQRDPVTTLKTLLTEALAAGYTIEGIAQGIDVQSIRGEALRQVQPLLEQQQQFQTQQQNDQAIEEEVTRFYQQFPDATIHDDVIAAVIAKNPQMSPSDAYFQLKSAAIDRGLDWSKPLAPQMQGGEQQQPQQEQQQKPMVNGRGPIGNTQVTKADRNVVAHESTSTGDIVKEAMREAGLKI